MGMDLPNDWQKKLPQFLRDRQAVSKPKEGQYYWQTYRIYPRRMFLIKVTYVDSESFRYLETVRPDISATSGVIYVSTSHNGSISDMLFFLATKEEVKKEKAQHLKELMKVLRKSIGAQIDREI